MKISIGSDHRGVDLKELLRKELEESGNVVIDMGCDTKTSVDYPDFAGKVARAVAAGDCDRGILICATGIGMSMAANKVKGVRAALCHDHYTAVMSRRHNDANLLVIGADTIGAGVASSIVRAWMETSFEGGRHERRVAKIMELERE